MLSQAAGGFLRPIYELVAEHYEPGETVLCAHALDLGQPRGGREIAAPLASVDFAPGMIWSIYDSPRLKGALTGPRVPKWLKRLQYWASDTLFVQPLLGKQLNGLRRELGLAAGEAGVLAVAALGDDGARLVSRLVRSAAARLAAEHAADGLSAVGRARGRRSCRAKCKIFWRQATPPIAFSPGSANREAHQFFEAAVEACERIGRRGILLTKYADQLPAKLPPSVRHFGFVPLSRLLPHTAALVHHGGIGTCAQGLAAGVPHLVRPMAFDQFDNSRRLVRLGVAEEISVKAFRGPAIAAALERLTVVADGGGELSRAGGALRRTGVAHGRVCRAGATGSRRMRADSGRST